MATMRTTKPIARKQAGLFHYPLEAVGFKHLLRSEILSRISQDWSSSDKSSSFGVQLMKRSIRGASLVQCNDAETTVRRSKHERR